MHTIIIGLSLLALILSVGLGGIIDRGVRGGANEENSIGKFFKKLPKFSRLGISAAFQVVFLLFFYQTIVLAVLIAFSLTFLLLAVATSEGHGEQMDLGKTPEELEGRNKIDLIFGKEGFWSEFWGLSFTGFLITAPMGLAIALSPLYTTMANSSLAIVIGVLYTLIGWSKGWCYLVAQDKKLTIPSLWVPGPDALGRNPDGGEFVWGTVKYGTLGLLTFLYVVLS